ncbi:MAG: polysaccharide biosynthesis protein [Bacillota bacterium]
MKSGSKLKSSLVKGTIQLTVAGAVTRVIGLVFRMALSRLVGAEGLGLFQMILPVYALLAVTAGLGLSGAITKMVADRHARGDLPGQLQARQVALRMVTVAALAVSAALWIGLAFPLKFIPDGRILIAVRLMPAAVLFAALTSILRGFFQGRSIMAPSAFSQVGEQLFRVLVGLAAANYLLPRGLEFALVGLVIGIIAGEIACFSIIALMTGRENRLKTGVRQPRSLLQEMFFLAVPILVMRLSTAITQMLESLLIPSRLLEAGFSASQATTLFGQLSGMALPLVFLPTVLIIPLNTTLVPAVAGAVVLRLRRRLYGLVKISLWGTLVLGAFSAMGLHLFAPALTGILYGSSAAAPLVARLAPAVPFAYLQFCTAAILHGMGRPGIAVVNDLAGTLTGLAIIYALTARPEWGINGVVVGYSVSFMLIALADCLAIAHLVRKV